MALKPRFFGPKVTLSFLNVPRGGRGMGGSTGLGIFPEKYHFFTASLSDSATGVKVFADGQILDNQWGVIAFCVYFAINCNTTAAETRSTFLHTSKYRTIVQCI